VLEGSITVARDTEAMINARIAQIDHLLSLQINEIMHHPDFQRLESSWRGLKYLMSQSETGTGPQDQGPQRQQEGAAARPAAAPEFDQSALFKKVYEEEYGVFGGTPFGALVGDYYFDKSGQDIELLEKVSNVAAAAHAPFLTGRVAHAVQPRQLLAARLAARPRQGVRHHRVREVEGVPADRGRALRGARRARACSCASRTARRRSRWTRSTTRSASTARPRAVPVGERAYALAANVNKAFALYGWCASIRGVESGGLVEGLPVHNFRTENGDLAMKCPTEVQITDRREKELADLGFAALVHQKGTPNAAFFSVQSAQKPKVYDTPAATASARMSAQLPYIFATSRFAHYLKVMMRDKIGGYMSRGECEVFLNRWIGNYVASENAPGIIKAKKPLSDARVDVVEIPGKPGAYRAVAFLRPHFQLDELGISMRLVADLPQPAA
jgi:type VI secretion system protein ImpC